MLVEITDQNFEEEVKNSDKLVLVDFWAPWCGPCKMLGPILEELGSELKNVKIVKMNIDEHLAIPSEMGIRSIPTMMIFKDGKNIDTKLGVLPKNTIKSWLQQYS